MTSDQDAMARLRELAAAKIAAADPIPDARRPLELILEASLKPVTRDDGAVDLIDESGVARVTVAGGEVRSESLDALVEALRQKHPRLFAAPEPALGQHAPPGAARPANRSFLNDELALWDGSLPESVVSAPAARRAAGNSPDTTGHAVPAAWPDAPEAVDPARPAGTVLPAEGTGAERIVGSAEDAPRASAERMAGSAEDAPRAATGSVRHGSRVEAVAETPSTSSTSVAASPRTRLLGVLPAILPAVWPGEHRGRGTTASARRSLRDRWVAGKDRVSHWRVRIPDWSLPFGFGSLAGLVAGLLLGGLLGEPSDAAPPPAREASRSQSTDPGSTGTLQAPADMQTAADESGPATDILRGVPEVLDTGTLRIQDKVVRLFGVEWARGGEAQDLAGYLRDREVVCRPVEERGPHRCEVDGRDLSEVVLYNGGGRATGEATPGLKSAENHARTQRLGVWARQQP